MGYLNKVRHFLEQHSEPQHQITPDADGQREVSAGGESEETKDSVFPVADEVERMLAMGARLRRGDISAVRCGATGKRCASCAGIPCLGSQQWEDA
jgi:hypothetical protein